MPPTREEMKLIRELFESRFDGLERNITDRFDAVDERLDAGSQAMKETDSRLRILENGCPLLKGAPVAQQQGTIFGRSRQENGLLAVALGVIFALLQTLEWLGSQTLHLLKAAIGHG